MKRWERPCEKCVVRAMCNQPCPKMVTYANIFLYELSINPTAAVWRHKYINDNQELLPDWHRLVDIMNTGHMITIVGPVGVSNRHSMAFEIRNIWETDDEGEQNQEVQEV